MQITGILHCHSSYSYDAKMSLRELKELFQKNGVHFVCMTEHTDELTEEQASDFVGECEALSDETFRFIPGFEVSYKHTHILMIGMRKFLGNYAPSIEVLRKWTKQAQFVVLAHPVRNNFQVDDNLLQEINALEVWNQQYEGKRVPRSRALMLLDQLRAQKPSLLATGGVDFHRTEHFGTPLVSLAVESLTEGSIIEKLKTGAFTVSSPQASFQGTLLNAEALKKKHWFDSLISVSVIELGKFVNKTLASCGLSLPKSLKQIIRKRL